jgi:hypothetical protein
MSKGDMIVIAFVALCMERIPYLWPLIAEWCSSSSSCTTWECNGRLNSP